MRTSTPDARTASSNVSRSPSPGAGRDSSSPSSRMPRTAARVWARASRAISAMRSNVARASSGSALTERPPGSRLHRDGAEVVADDVVDLACDPHALAGGRLARLRGAQLGQAGRSARAPAEQASLLAQHVGEQQRHPDHADVGDELEGAERLPVRRPRRSTPVRRRRARTRRSQGASDGRSGRRRRRRSAAPRTTPRSAGSRARRRPARP